MTPFSSENTQSCRGCGCTLGQIQRTGRLGCALCYRTFGNLITPQLARFHYGIEHVGKRPARLEAILRRAGLQDALARAIVAEEFERAASLRDRLAAQAGP